MSRRVPTPRSRRGRLRPTRILRISFRANRGFNRCLAQLLVADLKAGKSKWPVDTGLSRRSFYYRNVSTGGFELWNRAGYAGFIEARGRFAQRYWRGNRVKLISRCERQVDARDKLKTPQRRQKGRLRSYVNRLARFSLAWGARKRDDE